MLVLVSILLKSNYYYYLYKFLRLDCTRASIPLIVPKPKSFLGVLELLCKSTKYYSKCHSSKATIYYPPPIRNRTQCNSTPFCNVLCPTNKETYPMQFNTLLLTLEDLSSAFIHLNLRFFTERFFIFHMKTQF